MNISIDRMMALVAAVVRGGGGGGLVGPDQDDPPWWIGPKARVFSDPLPWHALLGAQAVISFTAMRFGGASEGGGSAFSEFLDEYCGSGPRPGPRPHVAGAIAQLATFTATLDDGAFKSRLTEATAMLVDRAFGEGGTRR